MVLSMVKEHTIGQMEISTKVIGKMATNMAKGLLHGLMELPTLVNGEIISGISN